MNTTKIEEIRQTLNEYMSKHGNTISQWKNNDYDYAQTLPVDEQEEIVPELITKIESLTKEAVSEALQELKDELPNKDYRYEELMDFREAVDEVTNIIDDKIEGE